MIPPFMLSWAAIISMLLIALPARSQPTLDEASVRSAADEFSLVPTTANPVTQSAAARQQTVAAKYLQTTEPVESDSEELAKKLSNPVADLISVPFQENLDFNIGPNNGWRSTLNIQPVIPITLNEDWNLITRTIVPVIYQNDVVDDGGNAQFGLGDTLQSFFFSPQKPGPGGLIWGVGPAFLWPTATNDSLGGGQWGVGPTGVLLLQKSGWTFGLLANQIWSYASTGDGDNRPSVNQTFIQPFIAYTTKTAFTLTLNTESTYYWNTSDWNIPINLMASQIVKFGRLPVSLQAGVRYYAQVPGDGPDWGLRFNVTFLLPK